MLYQLIHHDGAKSEVVATSPDLPSIAARDGWYNATVINHALPDGRSWAVIDEKHGWFVKPEAAPIDAVPPVKPLAPANAADHRAEPRPTVMQQPAGPLAAETAAKEPLAGAGLKPEGDLGPTGPLAKESSPFFGESPDFNEIMQHQQKAWTKEREEQIAEAEAIGKYLAAYNRR